MFVRDKNYRKKFYVNSVSHNNFITAALKTKMIYKLVHTYKHKVRYDLFYGNSVKM